VAREHTQLSHDFTTQRLLALRLALRDSGEHEQHAEPAFAAFFEHRNAVELFPDVPPALETLARRHPLAALTNGNADLARIGLGHHFRFSLGAREHGAAKPAASIFLAACARLELEPAAVMHVGDDPWMDVHGAAEAGLPTCWINRFDQVWPAQLPRPDLEVASLTELVAHLDGTAGPA
jgi:putative hydrolase of the HAD superfamily